MNLKYISLIIIILIVSFTLFFQKINFKSENINDLGIIDYIPNNNELSVISNANTVDINKFIKTNIKKAKKDEFITLKNGIYSFLGFNLQEEFKNIYDGEISLSIFSNDMNMKDLLLIIKVRDNSNINNILDIDDKFNKENEIIEFKRPGKINFLKYAYKTKENYIIFSSSQSLINLSINEHQNILNKSIIRDLSPIFFNQFKRNKLFIISDKNLINNILGKNYYLENEHFLTLLTYKNNKLNFESFLFNNNGNHLKEFINKEFNNLKIENSLILNGNLESFNRDLTALNINNTQTEIIKESQKFTNNQLFYLGNDEKWILAFEVDEDKYSSFDNLTILNDFHKIYLDFNGTKYYVFSKDIFNYKDNELFYQKGNPIFIKESNNIILLSNDISYLSHNKSIESFAKETLSNSNFLNNKLLINDFIYLNNSSNKIKNFNYPILDKINLFTNNLINLKVKNIKSLIQQRIPDSVPTIFIESELEVF